MFKVHFGLLTLKGYTKGEHVLRFEAIVHNTKTLHTGRVLEKFPDIVAKLAGMLDRFTSMQWMSMLTELRNRGVADVCIVCCDGLKGLPDAIAATWPPVRGIVLAQGCHVASATASSRAADRVHGAA